MATKEFLKRSIAAQKPYEALPERIRAILSHGEWKARYGTVPHPLPRQLPLQQASLNNNKGRQKPGYCSLGSHTLAFGLGLSSLYCLVIEYCEVPGE